MLILTLLQVKNDLKQLTVSKCVRHKFPNASKDFVALKAAALDSSLGVLDKLQTPKPTAIPSNTRRTKRQAEVTDDDEAPNADDIVPHYVDTPLVSRTTFCKI